MSSGDRTNMGPVDLHAKPEMTYPPPKYTKAAAQADEKITDTQPYRHSPWVVQRTSVMVESTPLYDDHRSDVVSMTSSTRSTEKRAIRKVLRRLGNGHSAEQLDDEKSIYDQGDASTFGTQVLIEGGNPKRQRIEMKGLEQAASMKRWIGAGKLAEAWGKLVKDPELWDPMGDTLVYFGYQRPQPSFRVKSSVLENTRSDLLIYSLQDGRRHVSTAPSIAPAPANPLRGFKALRIGKGSRQAPALAPEAGSRTGETQIRHEIHFPAPEDASRMEILRYHITTRNFMALLYDKPMVGLTLFQALVDLYERLQAYMPKGTNCARTLIRYLVKHRFHNVSNDPAAAAGLLAWCEDFEVQWEEGWREAFVHCCGMYNQLQSMPEYRDLSPETRLLLEHSHLELQDWVQRAESRLSDFRFDDVWPASTGTPSPIRTSFDRCRHFLKRFYEAKYKSWPPHEQESSHGQWLTRNTALDLQRDFGALYDFFVDRNVVWGITQSGERHRSMISKGSQAPLMVSNGDISLAKLFTQFDHKHKFANIPHPYPLLPASASGMDIAKLQQPLFGSKTKALEKRMVQEYSEASNAAVLGQQVVVTNGLVEAFIRFEKTDQLGDASLREARIGRWVLLYCVFQILSTISVDTPNLSFKDVTYFLNPRLKGMPPWKSEASESFEAASSSGSYFWKAPSSWV